MKQLDQSAFLERLTVLFQEHRLNGAVVLTMKRYDGRTKPIPKGKEKTTPAPNDYRCLIRAYVTGNGNKKNKISTIVHQKEVIKFQKEYCALLKSNIDGLKKSKKIKKTKT